MSDIVWPDYEETSDGQILCTDPSRLTEPLHLALVALEARVHEDGWDQLDHMWVLHQPDPAVEPTFTAVPGYPGNAKPQELLGPYIGSGQLPPWWPRDVFGTVPTPLTGIVTVVEGWALTGKAAQDETRNRQRGRRGPRISDRPDRVEVRQLIANLVDASAIAIIRQHGGIWAFTRHTIEGEANDAVTAFLRTVHQIYRSRGLA